MLGRMKYNAFNTPHHCYGGIWEQAPGLRKKASSQKGGIGAYGSLQISDLVCDGSPDICAQDNQGQYWNITNSILVVICITHCVIRACVGQYFQLIAVQLEKLSVQLF